VVFKVEVYRVSGQMVMSVEAPDAAQAREAALARAGVNGSLLVMGAPPVNLVALTWSADPRSTSRRTAMASAGPARAREEDDNGAS